MATPPRIVGLGGTVRENSSSEAALRACLGHARKIGAHVEAFVGTDLILPMYDPEDRERSDNAKRLVTSLREADGVIICSPGYHGSISGMIKNALDYVEELRADKRPYFENRPVGLIACSYGWQATGSTLAALRSVTHALRGWPTPLGVGINSLATKFNELGECSDAGVSSQLAMMTEQVVHFCLHQTH